MVAEEKERKESITCDDENCDGAGLCWEVKIIKGVNPVWFCDLSVVALLSGFFYVLWSDCTTLNFP